MGFSPIKYSIENWVWLGLELGLQSAVGPFLSSLELVLLGQPSPAGWLSCGHRNSSASSEETITASSHPTVLAPL